jgi:DNA helicase-2/ATP-dependent DNA helicase PcrA
LSLTQGFRGEAKVSVDQDVPAMAKRIVDHIQRLQDDGQSFDDMAILVRLNAQTPHIEQNLITAGIPYRVSNPFYERPEIVTLINYCRLAWVEQRMVADPHMLQRTSISEMVAEVWNDITNRPKRYISNQHKEQILRAMLVGRASLSQTLVNYADLVEEDWLAENLKRLASKIEWLANNLDKPAGKTLSTLEIGLEYKQFLRDSSGFIQTGEAKAASVAAFIDYAHGYDALFTFMQHIRELAESGAGKPDSNSDVAVTLSTIHKAKGLEWPVIFVPQCNEGVNPFLSENQNDNLEEERRLFYVAITRARHSLYLYYVQNRPISRFLKQANWGTTLKSVAALKAVLAKSPGQWLVEDALTVAKMIPSLNFNRYFELWWDVPPAEQQEIAHTMQRFYAAVKHHNLFRRLHLDQGGEALWRTLSPLPASTPVDDFPGLERYLPEKKTKPDTAQKQERQRKKGDTKLAAQKRSEKRTSVTVAQSGQKTKEAGDSLNQRMKRVRDLGDLATVRAIRELIEMLGDSSSTVRYLAGFELRKIGGLRVVDAFEGEYKATGVADDRLDEVRKVLKMIVDTDSNPAVQQRARLTLERLGDENNL